MVVLEEDALVVAGFHRRLREVLCDLPATWDVLYLNAHHAGNLSVTPRDPRHATEQVTRGALLYKVARVVRFFTSDAWQPYVQFTLGAQGLQGGYVAVIEKPAQTESLGRVTTE